MWSRVVYLSLVFSCIMIIAGVLLTFFTVTNSIKTNRSEIIINRQKIDSLLKSDNSFRLIVKDTVILMIVKKDNQLLIKINDKL